LRHLVGRSGTKVGPKWDISGDTLWGGVGQCGAMQDTTNPFRLK
jgi:hypothetical protein